MAEAASRIGIIGAGLSGLTLALALRSAGIDAVTLFEQTAFDASGYDPDAAQAPVTAPVMLPPNATRVLRAIGLREVLDSIAYTPQGLAQRSGRNGFLMGELPLGALAASRYGAPYYIVDYPQLRAALYRAALEQHIEVRLERRCIARLHQTAHFVDGGDWTADLLVGADGVDSVLRATLAGAAQPLPARGIQWSGAVPMADVPASLRQPKQTLWLGPGAYVSHCPTADGEHLYWRACSLGPSPAEPSLQERFRGWQPALLQLLARTEAPRSEPLADYAAPQALSDQGFALLGDAAHPLAPHLDQGAALALEDAWVLSRFIDQLEGDPAAATAQYQRFRHKRVALMTERAVAEGARRGAAAGLPRALDRLKTSLTSRFLPELAMQRLDWMFRYDCVRGFE